jgi:DUF917 family protein
MNNNSFNQLTANTKNPSTAHLNKGDLEALIYGACFFASGGGGPISMALQFLTKINKDVPLIQRRTLSANEKIVILADMGSPDAATEGRGYTAPVNAYKTISAYIKEKESKNIAYFMPIETGAVNSLIPFFIASQLDTPIPIVDADPSGRAVPQLNETLLDVNGQAICPAAVASDTQTGKGYRCCWSNEEFVSKIFTDMSATQLEKASRIEVSKPSYQQVGGLACYPLESNYITSAGAQDALVENSISCSIGFGKTLLDYPGVSTLSQKLSSMDINNFCFIDGIISKIDNRTKDGFDVGKITLSNDDGEIWIYYKNESLLAWNPADKKALAIAPDCINLLLSKTSGDFTPGTPLSTADIKEGQSCTVWGTACSSKMRNPTIEALFQIDIQQILAAFPDDKITITGYTNLETLNE